MVKKDRWVRILWGSLCLAVMAAVYALLISRGVGFVCPIYELTGIQCPGCGNSRAFMCLLRWDFTGSYACNPMFIPQICYMGWIYVCCCMNYLKGKRFAYVSPAAGMDLALLILFVLWGILRNFLL